MAILGQITVEELLIVTVDQSPITSGIPAPIGSLALLDDDVNAQIWIKTGAGNTAWTAQPKVVPGTSLQNNTLVYTDATGQIKTDTTKFTWDQTNGRLGIGLAAPATPQSTIHMDRGTGVGSHVRFTAGSTTGQTAGDGLEIGIDNAGNAELIQYENNYMTFLTNNIRLLTLTPTGQAIIGNTTTPIDITGASAIPLFQIIGLGAVQMAQIQYSADTIAPVFNAIKSRGATIGTQGLLLQDDELGRFQFRGSDGVNFQAGASIRALVDGTAAAGSMPGRLIFMTTPAGATTPVEHMRISQDGLVRVFDNLQSLKRVFDYQTTVSANTTTNLTSASAGIQYFTGTTAGQIVRLPDATTLVVGAWYEIRNRNSQTTISVANNGGAVLDTTPAVTGTTICHLLDNSNSNGTWDVRTRFEPFSQEVSSTAGMSINSTTDVLITRMTITPPAGTYRVTFDAAVTATTNNSTLGFAVYAGGTINTSSNKSFQFSPANAIKYIGTTGTVTVNGSQSIEIRGRRSAGTTTVNVRTMQITRVG